MRTMPDEGPTLTLTKLDVARRQLRTACELWFADGDPISIHTLAFAAYEIIHVLSKKRNRPFTLLFDSIAVKDEFRNDWNRALKKSAAFFKHANNDAEASIDFHPESSDFFIIFAIRGLNSCGIVPEPIERAFQLWQGFHRPNFFSKKGRKLHIDRTKVDELDYIRRMSKSAFLTEFMKGANSALRDS
jgi:hypothetical protein